MPTEKIKKLIGIFVMLIILGGIVELSFQDPASADTKPENSENNSEFINTHHQFEDSKANPQVQQWIEIQEAELAESENSEETQQEQENETQTPEETEPVPQEPSPEETEQSTQEEPEPQPEIWQQVGNVFRGEATWYQYGDAMTAASTQFERGSMVRVINLENDKQIDVRINDYGPELHTGAVLDLNLPAFEALAPAWQGRIPIRYYKIEPSDGSDQ